MAMIKHFTDCSSGPSGPSVAVEQDGNARSRRVAVFLEEIYRPRFRSCGWGSADVL